MATASPSAAKPAARNSVPGAAKSAPKSPPQSAAQSAAQTRIAENRKALFDYHIEERFEAGIVLEGWEVKAIRAGQVQLTDGYVLIRDGELHLIGCRINALRSASTHVNPQADRTRKLLMKRTEIRRLIGKVEQKGFTLVPLNLHFKGGLVKAEIALAKGKAEHDKRETEKKRDWEREKGRLMRTKVASNPKT